MKFDLIYADPPWWWRPRGSSALQLGKRPPYALMTTSEIAKLPVGDLAADDCVLLLWATVPMLEHALRVMKAWGFSYRTRAWEWVKLNRSSIGFYLGLGYYTRQNSEPCLLGIRGSMNVAVHGEPALIVSPLQSHSRKPLAAYEKINRLWPETRRLELFASKASLAPAQQYGFTPVGADVDGQDIRKALASLIARPASPRSAPRRRSWRQETGPRPKRAPGAS